MFNLQDQKYISLLDVNAEIYNHSEFNFPHIHLGSNSDEKVFMVAFRTMPENSKGVAHILEHTALCGSKKYPVRDPFFMMIRRSLNTFMNAFTSSDWTAYPFATQNKKDFDNLLSVYLDASFFPNLHELDFAQEGHRIEFKEGSEEIEIKGVVYNEMKGAMSSVTSQLWHGMSKHLYPSSTYQFNSGGNPEDILELTHDELIEFHKTHYHPSNAIFLTSGNLNPKEIQSYIEENVLTQFNPLKEEISVNNETRFTSPKIASEIYNPQPGDEENHHVVLSWLLGESHKPQELLETYLLSSILLDNSASPLRKVLENTSLGKSLSPLTGLDSDQKELVFAAGLEGVSSNQEKDVENLIINCLEDLVKDGVDEDLINSSIHQLEISQREIGGNGMPFGLQLMLSCLPACIHRDDPLQILDLDNSFNLLKKNLKTDRYIENLIQNRLLNNNHRLLFSLIPDGDLNKRNEQLLKEELKEKAENLSENEKEQISSLAKRLKSRQESEDNPEILPKVGISDIPKERIYAEPASITDKSTKNYIYKTGTNGLVYHSMIYPINNLTIEELSNANLYANFITNLGVGNRDYEEVQKYQSSITGGLNASTIFLPGSNADSFKLGLKISAKSLEKNAALMQDLILETVEDAIFTENKRIKELIEFTSSSNDRSIIQNGHMLAMGNAASQLNDYASTIDMMSGVRFISNLNNISKHIGENNNLNIFSNMLESMHKKVAESPSISYLASSLDTNTLNLKNNYLKSADWFDQDLNSNQSNPIAWVTGSQVCFCSEAFSTVKWHHEDAAALLVLSTVLRNGYLHSAIREKGGAYGAGASQDLHSGIFRFYSYRDPKCIETFKEFKKSREWALNNISESQLEEGILGVVSSIDKPLSPSGETKDDFLNRLDNRTIEQRLKFRSNVIECKLSDLKKVAEKYLLNNGAKSAIGGKSFIDEFSALNFEIKEI
ncbi:MAG: insulinase family protein [Gammaproteobacteria bacterium]